MEIEKNKHVQWIDVEKPTAKDLVWLEKKFKLHPIIVDELKAPSARAHVEQYDDYLYFVYYFPLYDAAEASSVRTEIDFVVTKDAVATVHYEPLTGVLDTFHLKVAPSSLQLVYGLIQHLIDFEERQLRHIREKVEAIGHDMFHGQEKEILEKLTHLKRDISEYRIVVRLQEPILNSLLSRGKNFWGKDGAGHGDSVRSDAEVYLNDLLGDHLKVVNQIEDYREAVRDYEATNSQLMNVKINTAMRTFTALSFLTFPFVLLAAILALPVADNPVIDFPGAFWFVLGLVVLGMIALGLYFKNRKWF
jgi:magnesium transporter